MASFTRVSMADVDLNTRLDKADKDYNDAKTEWKKATTPADKEFWSKEMDDANTRRAQLEKDLGKVKRTITACDS